MSTDRPTAIRATALPQRPYAGTAERTPAAPSDAFSALLGAATPRPADAPRADAPRPRRDDAPRADAPRPRRDDAPRSEAPRARREDPRAEQPSANPKAGSAAQDEQPKTDAPAAEAAAAEAPTDAQPRPVLTPDLFALQLASPLPATPAPVAVTPTPPLLGAPVAAEGEAPAIPVFPQLTNLLTAPLPAQPAGEAALGEAPAPVVAPATPGGIPLPFLAGLTPGAEAELPQIELPTAASLDVPTDVAAPTLDAATAALPDAAGGDASSSDTPQPQTPQPGPSAPSAKSAEAPAPAPAPAAASAQPVAQAAPMAPAAPMPQASALQRAVPLYRAPESAAQMIQLAAERGVTHAKLNLKPVELGGIEVRLQTTPQGVTAQLVADSAEAAKLLTQAADDLRRDLADRDVNLLSLDVTTQQDYQQQQAGSKQADIFGDQLPGDRRSVRVGLHGDAGLTETPEAADTSLVLPNGVLVDVLA